MTEPDLSDLTIKEKTYTWSFIMLQTMLIALKLASILKWSWLAIFSPLILVTCSGFVAYAVSAIKCIFEDSEDE